MKDASLILHYSDPVRVISGKREARVTMLGPKFIWHTDGYDIGLCINWCICEFSLKIIWVNVYQTNNHPKTHWWLLFRSCSYSQLWVPLEK